jgi:hypothetical protein
MQGRIPRLSDVRGTLFHPENNRLYEIGRCHSNSYWEGGVNDREFLASVEWKGTLGALADYERIRNGRPVALQVRFVGQVHLLSFTQNQPLRLDLAPFAFHGQEQLAIATEGWAMVLRELGVIDVVLIHIPLTNGATEPMIPVWTALQSARDDFTAGGAAGWRGCGIHIRQALTHWETAEKLDLGKGITDKRMLTKDQRLDNLRFHLREFTHIAGHPDPAVAGHWTRDDALLALSTACALINAKKP